MSHFQYGSLLWATQRITTTGGTTTAVATTKQVTQFIGTLAQNFDLPNATTLKNGREYVVDNASSGIITVRYNDGSTLKLLTPNQSCRFVLTDNGTSNGIWSAQSGGGSGSGGGGMVNLIEGDNADFNNSTIGDWLRYVDAAGVRPVDGTGGSPSANLTFVASNSSPMEGAYSGLLSKINGVNLQGEGISLSSIEVENYLAGQKLSAGFYFEVVSGTYVQGDLRAYIYDQTNSELIEADIFEIPGTVAGVSKYFVITEVPTKSNTALLRFIIHQSSTTTQNYVLKFDKFFISPLNLFQGAAVGDWEDWNPTIVNLTLGNATKFAKYRRVGDSYECFLVVNAVDGTTSSSGELSIPMPNNALIDTTKLPSNLSVVNHWLGGARAHGTGSNGYVGNVYYSSNQYVKVFLQNGPGTVNDAFAFGLGAGGGAVDFTTNIRSFGIRFTVPIVGLTSGVALANSRVEYASNSNMASDSDDTTSFTSDPGGSQLPTVTYTANRQKRVRFATPSQPGDTYQVQFYDFNSANWQDWKGGGSFDLAHFENNVSYGFGNLSGVNSTDMDVSFGQYRRAASGSYGGAGSSWNGLDTRWKWRVVRYRNALPVEVSTQEKARYHLSGSQNIPGTTPTILNFDVKDWDTDNLVTTGATWKFTAKRGGYYKVKGSFIFNAGGTWQVGDSARMELYKNNVLWSYLWNTIAQAAHGTFVMGGGDDTVYLNPDDFIDLRMLQNADANLSIVSSIEFNFVTIERLP